MNTTPEKNNIDKTIECPDAPRASRASRVSFGAALNILTQKNLTALFIAKP